MIHRSRLDKNFFQVLFNRRLFFAINKYLQTEVYKNIFQVLLNGVPFCRKISRRGSRGGEMGEFLPPFSFFFFSYPSNIEIIFDFSD